jgi:hypothetical protein
MICASRVLRLSPKKVRRGQEKPPTRDSLPCEGDASRFAEGRPVEPPTRKENETNEKE